MKSTEFITEDNDEVMQLAQQFDIPADMVSFVSMIKKDCQPYLQATDNDPFYGNALYRGMDGGNNITATKTLRIKDRIPTDTPKVIHDKLNEIFVAEFGIPYRNTMFATGSYDRARGYGEDGMHPGSRQTFIIFPAGPFKYIWSPVIDDLFTDVIWPLKSDPTSSKVTTVIDEEIRGAYKSSDLKDGIEYGHEIMIYCERYYAIKADYVKANSEGLEALLATL